MRRHISDRQLAGALARAARRPTLITILLALIAAASYFYQPHMAAGPTASQREGVASVHDGDTFTLGDRAIRLHAIDAPELKQTCQREGRSWACGEASRDALMELTNTGTVTCTHVSYHFAREVARCTVGGKDLGEAMVATGFAVAYRQHSKAYVAAEQAAKAAKLGLWSSRFTLPADWRKQHRKMAGNSLAEGDMEWDD